MTETKFDWQRFPGPDGILQNIFEQFTEQNSFLDRLVKRMLAHAGGRLYDWVDAFILSADEFAQFSEYETEIVSETPEYKVYRIEGSLLPDILVGNYGGVARGLILKVERIADFQAANHSPASIAGIPFSGFRRSLVNSDNQIGVFVVERRVANCYEPLECSRGSNSFYQLAWEEWMTRPRQTRPSMSHSDMQSLLEETYRRARKIVDWVGTAMAADVVMNVERIYWQARNQLGRELKLTLDQLGFGWANHDHHTFRCSREYFGDVIRIMEIFGFIRREKYFAGAEAGWGAQVMEHPAGFSLFIDVDLDPGEVDLDFPEAQLPVRNTLGTVGLWCKLHGESLFDAGIHHLAGRFNFTEIQHKLTEEQKNPMAPFSEFSYLKQFFSKGEFWPVSSEKIDYLLSGEHITPDKAQAFKRYGALGSHLEIIERNDGYKGFNQKNISDIIHRTDPRDSV